MEYEYKFVTIKPASTFWGRPKDDHHRIVDEHARQGWRLVQIFSPGVGVYGMSTFYELIFERPIG